MLTHMHTHTHTHTHTNTHTNTNTLHELFVVLVKIINKLTHCNFCIHCWAPTDQKIQCRTRQWSFEVVCQFLCCLCSISTAERQQLTLCFSMIQSLTCMSRWLLGPSPFSCSLCPRTRGMLRRNILAFSSSLPSTLRVIIPDRGSRDAVH